MAVPNLDDTLLAGQTLPAVQWQRIAGGMLLNWPRQYEADFGSTPTGPKQFTVTDVDVTTSSFIHVVQSGATPTGGFGDEAELDPMLVTAKPGSGSFTLAVTPLAGLVSGKFKFLYVLG